MGSLRALLASLGGAGAVANARAELERHAVEERVADALEAKVAPAPRLGGAAADAA